MQDSAPRNHLFINGGKPALVLAPMEGVVDAPMRAFMTERGGFTYCVSEFVRISQEPLSRKTFRSHIPELSKGARTSSGVPIQVQLLGGHTERLALSALAAIEAGAEGIDLNFGCPAPTVNRHDGGATLLKFPERIREIVSAVRRAMPTHIPLSAKLRLGWDDASAIHRNADMVVEGGASWITVHGRTKVQGYQPPAYWGPIAELRSRLPIPVVANGEIWTLDDFKRCRDETKCDHFMIGRGALADPNLSLQIAHELGLASYPCIEELNWKPLMERFAHLAYEFSGKPGYVSCRIKQWAGIVHKKHPKTWYPVIRVLKTPDEILAQVHSN